MQGGDNYKCLKLQKVTEADLDTALHLQYYRRFFKDVLIK